ncbi:MAG: flavin reductase family protein [Clostridia bacterium]|nr:flavin reductase family protein [Clostridia bacterium]MBQ9847899.1 flavin reductase family protein [Clostridia bacterium]
MSFKEISPNELNTAIFDDIGNKWMLISAAKEDGTVNTMTASWGTVGVLWNKNVFICFIRPQRYTFEFTEASDKISLSFFGEEHRAALKLCGTKSGRDCDKIALAGLDAFVNENGVGFEQAERIIYGKKLYCGRLDPKCFLDEGIEKHYDGDYHYVYICEIEKIEEREQ